MNSQKNDAITDDEAKLGNAFKNLFINIPNGKKDGIQIMPFAELTAKDDLNSIKPLKSDERRVLLNKIMEAMRSTACELNLKVIFLDDLHKVMKAIEALSSETTNHV